MPKYEESGVSLILDIDDYRRNIQEAISLAGELESTLGGLSDFSVNVGVEFDAGDVDSQIADIADEAPTITISADLEESSDLTDFEALDGETLDATVNPDVNETSSLLELENLDETPIKAEIDTVEGGEKIGGKSLLTKIHELGINPTQIVMNIAGTLLDGLKAIDDFTVQPLLDLDSAVARVNAQTANAIPNAHELISGIFYDDLGDSINQVANLVIQAQQIGAPIDEATRAALTFTHTFTDQDPSQVLNTMNQLVVTGLVPNFTTASDLLVTGFQEGDNRAGDLLSTLNENAGAISDLGLNGQQAMSLIKTGLDGGAASASDVLNTLIKIKANVIGAAGNQTSDVTQLLANLGIPNPVDSGGTWSADFFTSVRDAIANAPVDDATKQQMFSTLVGGKIGAKEYSAFLNIDAADPAFNSLAGKAADAATSMDDSLSGAIDDFKLAAQAAAADFLSSDAIDLPGKIDALKTGLQDALSVLSSGGSLGDALTVGLKPIGFDDEFQKLEEILGNFVLALLNLVADIQDILGKDSTGTRETIATQAQTQTAFNLAANDPSKIADTINTAFAMGFKGEDFAKTLQEAVTTLVNQGNTEGAQALLDASKNLQLSLPPGSDIDSINQAILDATKAAQDLIDAGVTVKTRAGETPGTRGATDQATTWLDEIAKSGTTAALDDMATANTDLTPTIRDAGDALAEQKTGMAELKTTTDGTTASVDAMTTSTNELASAAGDASLLTSDTANSLSSLIAQEQALEAQLASGAISLDDFNQKLAQLIAIAQAGGGGGTGGGANPDVTGAQASGGIIPGGRTHLVGEKGAELVTANTGLAVLNNRTTQAIMAALSPMGMSMSSAQSGGNVYNVNNYNYVQSQAQADAMGYRTAAQIRGLN